MTPQLLAHVSDLHLGKSRSVDRRVAALAERLIDDDIGHVVVTGDVTHRGRREEWQTFRALFAPLYDAGRITVVPGNHDCLGDEVSAAIMPGPRVQTVALPGLFLVLVNSTAPHNRSWISAHGALAADDIQGVSEALDRAPAGVLVAILLHHHVLPLPADSSAERLVGWLGWRFTDEIERAVDLLETARGRCDLVLHGHRHIPRRTALPSRDARPLFILNAGCTTDLGRFQVFTYAGGRVLGERTVAVAPRDQGSWANWEPSFSRSTPSSVQGP